MATHEPTPGNSISKVLIPIVAIIALAIGGLLLIKSQITPKEGTGGPAATVVGGTVPDFTLHQHPDGEIKLSELIQRDQLKVILINFWATWCSSCVIEMPSIISLRNQYRPKGFEVLFIDMDENPAQVLPAFLKRIEMPVPIFTDRTKTLGDLFDIHAIPLTLIIDQNRKILLTESGERDWTDDSTRSSLERWLSQ